MLTWTRAFQSGVYRRVVWAVFIISTLAVTASWFSISIPDFGCTWVAGTASCQPVILSRAKAGHECREGRHGLRFFLAEVSGEPLVVDIMLKGRQGFGVRTVNNLVLFGEEPVPEFAG